MRHLLAITLLALALAGCGGNPLGATTRTQIRADADVRIAEAQASADKHAATQETIQTGMIVAIAPWLLLIIAGTVVASIVVWWQGKIWHTRTSLAAPPPAPPVSLPYAQPAPPALANLRALAQREGYTIEIDGDVLYLVDGQRQRVGQRRLTD